MYECLDDILLLLNELILLIQLQLQLLHFLLHFCDLYVLRGFQCLWLSLLIEQWCQRGCWIQRLMHIGIIDKIGHRSNGHRRCGVRCGNSCCRLADSFYFEWEFFLWICVFNEFPIHFSENNRIACNNILALSNFRFAFFNVRTRK